MSQEPLTDEEKFALLNKECWRLLEELIYNGTAQLKSGMPMHLKPEAFFDQVMRLAQMKPPKTRKAPTVVDFEPGVTYSAEAKDPRPPDTGELGSLER